MLEAAILDYILCKEDSMNQEPLMPPSSDEPTQPTSQPFYPQPSGPLPPPPGPLPRPTQPFPPPSGQIPQPGFYPPMQQPGPTFPPTMPPPKKGVWGRRLSLPVWVVIILCLVLIGVGYAAGQNATGTQNTPGNTPVAQASTPTTAPPQSEATQAPTQAPTAQPTATPAPTFPQFDDGTYQVGKDIQPGTYRTRVASSGCYYARLKGFGGTVDDIIANNLTDAPAIVTIASTDKGFTSQSCGTWTKDLSQITPSKTSFGDGMFIVGTDITPGTYRSTGAQGCYYARLKGFGNTTDDIIANNLTDTPAIVTISSRDKGFQSNGCGTWTKQ